LECKDNHFDVHGKNILLFSIQVTRGVSLHLIAESVSFR